MFGLFSVTCGVHRRPDIAFVVVHFDRGTETGPVSTVGLWVSVIDESRESACRGRGDLVGAGTRAAIGFEGDLLLALEQVLRGGRRVGLAANRGVYGWLRLDADQPLRSRRAL